MNLASGETVVAIGMTDGYRYIGVTPPLTSKEIFELVQMEVVEYPIQDVDEFEPHCSMMMVAGDLNFSSPEEKTRITQKKAAMIAKALGKLRGNDVRLEQSPVTMIGFNSSPFTPRHR